MSKRFYYDEFLEEIYDEQIDDYPSNRIICEILNKQDQRISELEEQLKNAIVPKFKIGDKVYANTADYWENNKPVRHTTQEEVEEVVFFYKLKGYWFKDWKKEEIFATKEEAQAKLEKLKGENK